MLKIFLTAAFIAMTSGMALMALAGPFVDISSALDRGAYNRASEPARPLAEQGDAESQAPVNKITRAEKPASHDKGAATRSLRVASVNPRMAVGHAAQPVRQTRQAEPRQETAAVRRYRKTAETGHATAQNTLGTLLAHGKGVAQDRVHAYMWFYLAADQGFALARRNQARQARLMTPAEIAEAENLAGEQLARTLASAADQSEDQDAG